MLDDQPVHLKTRTKPIVNIPYTQECNDVAMILIQHHKAAECYDRAVDQFRAAVSRCGHLGARHGARRAPLHHWGPHRLKYFRNALTEIRRCSDVTFWTGEQILDWYRTQTALNVTRSSNRRR
jgi:hypothetical protein